MNKIGSILQILDEQLGELIDLGVAMHHHESKNEMDCYILLSRICICSDLSWEFGSSSVQTRPDPQHCTCLKGQCHQIRMALKWGSFKGLS